MNGEFSEDPDARILKRVAQGETNAFEAIVLKYQKMVLNTAFRFTGNRATAEDLAQEVFLRVFRAAGRFRPEALFSTWLYRIVRNVCLSYRSRETKHHEELTTEAEFVLITRDEENPEARLLQKETDKKIQKAILELPESLRLPFILNQFNHLQYEQIAKVLDLSLPVVKVRIHRARKMLIEKLKVLL